MKLIIETYKKKPFVLKIAYIAMAVMLISDIVFLIINGKDQTFDIRCFILLMVGSVIGLLSLKILSNVLLWVTSILYSIAVAFHLYVGLPSISDLWNNVNFIGGNQEISIVFGIIFTLGTIIVVISNFIGESNE